VFHTPFPPRLEDIDRFAKWLIREKVEVLNVAGHAEGKAPGIQRATQTFVVTGVQRARELTGEAHNNSNRRRPRTRRSTRDAAPFFW